MAIHRPEISTKIKKSLRAQSGGKCANPGCSSLRTHIHHIREWAIYQAHDEEHMIAVCPSCHDAIHHGCISIDDETLYCWKKIIRNEKILRGHIYVEPSPVSKILLGTIAVRVKNGASIFELSKGNYLKMEVIDNEVLFVDLTICDKAGEELVRVVRNHARHIKRDEVHFLHQSGVVEVSGPAIEDYIPDWVVQQMKIIESDFAKDGRFKIISVIAIAPGIAKIEGAWAVGDRYVVITKEFLAVLRRDKGRPLTIVGEGEHSVLFYDNNTSSIPLLGFLGSAALNLFGSNPDA